jgi:hypothetical protein
MNIKELKEIIADLPDSMEVFNTSYNPHWRETSYEDPNIKTDSISRNSSCDPIECKEGEGGNEIALLIS